MKKLIKIMALMLSAFPVLLIISIGIFATYEN